MSIRSIGTGTTPTRSAARIGRFDGREHQALQDTLSYAHPSTRRYHPGVIELDGIYRVLTASSGHHPAPTLTPLSYLSPLQAVRGEPLSSPEAITDLKPGRRCEVCGRFFFCPAALHTFDQHTAVAGSDLKALLC